MSRSKSELITELHRMAEENGHPPTLLEIREESRFSPSTYFDYFGSWQDALEAAGYEPRPPQTEVSEEALLSELQRVADELGETPSAATMDEIGEYWVSTYQSHFGSWSEAIDAAGLPEHTRKDVIPKEDLLDEIRRLSDKLDKRPSQADMREHGAYSLQPYRRRFGTWGNALEVAGFDAPPTPKETKLSKAELREELQRLADTLGKRPARSDMEEHGKYASSTYERHFGTWSEALEETFS